MDDADATRDLLDAVAANAAAFDQLSKRQEAMRDAARRVLMERYGVPADLIRTVEALAAQGTLLRALAQGNIDMRDVGEPPS